MYIDIAQVDINRILMNKAIFHLNLILILSEKNYFDTYLAF